MRRSFIASEYLNSELKTTVFLNRTLHEPDWTIFVVEWYSQYVTDACQLIGFFKSFLTSRWCQRAGQVATRWSCFMLNNTSAGTEILQCLVSWKSIPSLGHGYSEVQGSLTLCQGSARGATSWLLVRQVSQEFQYHSILNFYVTDYWEL